ncbi:hypothetical protein [Clostridium isatidis]|uniref:prenylated flavin chaperone LpdD n=1 Tax=Clostridium isatidis TaxID=182773 RepID=UPI003AACD91D
MINLTKQFKNKEITLTALFMGRDLNVSIYGGDLPHIGAIALGIPRPSLEDKNKISSSVSLLTITGHKEDVIVQKLAKVLSKSLNSTVVVSCGIHYDNITLEDIEAINLLISDLTDELISKLS